VRSIAAHHCLRHLSSEFAAKNSCAHSSPLQNAELVMVEFAIVFPRAVNSNWRVFVELRRKRRCRATARGLVERRSYGAALGCWLEPLVQVLAGQLRTARTLTSGP
jgi:hypothetical protein